MRPALHELVTIMLRCVTLLLLFLATRMGRAATAENPPRLKRADSFLGIHFDLHAGEDCTEMGKNTTPEMIERIIDLVQPDYLQIDCKGHPGLSSYPTKVGHPAPGFVGDPLRVWRDVTARRGVALYMHYSGVWDSKAVKEHPEWAAVNADGGTNSRATSFFGPYAEKLLIPQLRELAGDYGVDGAWVDGECWASVPDYGQAALRAFRDSTGIQNVPRKPGDPHWYEFLQFHRQMFRDYLNHYIAELRQTHPEFQICSNWAFTDHMPEPVCAPVDFLSGDYSPQNSVNSARLSARFLARLNTEAAKPQKVGLIAIGSAGPPALHAAALEPQIFDSLELRQSLASWSDVVGNPGAGGQLANTVHGALRVYDLPNLVETLPPKNVNIDDPLQLANDSTNKL